MKAAAQKELDRLASFWRNMDEGPDKGFSSVDGFGRITKGAAKGATSMGRVLYALSAAYRATGDDRCLRASDDAFSFIRSKMWDPENGGIWQLVEPDGSVPAREKRTYEQAFVLYGLSEYLPASENREALELSKELFRLLEAARGTDPGYADYYLPDWSAPTLGTLRPGKLAPTEHSLDSQSHVLEAYSNLFRAWPDEGLRSRIHAITALMLEKIYQPEGYMGQTFRYDWSLFGSAESYGDNVEVSWFLTEAALLTGDEALTEKANNAAVALTDRSLRLGKDPQNGGLWDRIIDGEKLTDKLWWNQCEAVNGCLNAWKLTGEERYLREAESFWRFLEEKQISREGWWYARLREDGSPYDSGAVRPGVVCPYHNIRTCIRTIAAL